MRAGAADELHHAEVGVTLTAIRVGADRLLDLGHRVFDPVQAGQRVRPEDQRRHVGRLGPQRLFGARLRVVELAREEQHLAHPDLRVDVGRHQVGRAHVLLERIADVAELEIGLRELQPRLAEPGILLDRVAVLDDRFAKLLLRDVRVAASDELPLRDFRILRASGERQHAQQRQHGGSVR
jgi:hypothetical protein